MKGRWLLLSVVILAVFVLLTQWFLEKAKNQNITAEQDTQEIIAPLAMQWHSGIAQQYQVLSESSMTMQAATPGASTINVNLHGNLDTLPLEINNGEALIGMRFSSIELEINTETDSDTNRALTTPFRVRYTDNGMPQAFEFSADVDQQNRLILENLVRTFQVNLDESTNIWTVVESNNTGTYEASYERTSPAQIKKSKHKFLSTAADIINWSGISSTETISIEAGRNWLADMDVQETMTSSGQAMPAMTINNYASLKLIPGAQLSLTVDLWKFKAVALAVNTKTTLKRSSPNMTTEQARKKIQSTIPELDKAEQGRLALIHRLRDLLSVDDTLPAMILDALKKQKLSDRTRADLYLALELTGTDSAQAALAEVITDDNWSLQDGMRAIVAMGGIEQPTPESIDTLWQRTQYDTGGERQRMTSAATFALGSIGDTMRKADSPEYETLRSTLLSNALGAGDTTQRSNYITAIGNTQDETLANDIVNLLDDAEPTIRRAAALSLGSLGADQVADKLVTHYKTEDNGYVRGAITESLQHWSEPTESAMEMFRQTVQTEKDERTRYNIAQILSENLKEFPENESVLREIMRKEPSKRIRQNVGNALSSQ